MIATSAPPILIEKLLQPAQQYTVPSDGVAVAYRGWNAEEKEKPPLLMVHGFLGHSHWWDWIAPFFIDKYRVFAMDFSGMGDSGHRRQYSLEYHTCDMAAVIEAIGPDPLTIVGHSYGGTRTVRLCVDFPHLVKRVVILDSWLNVFRESLPEFGGKVRSEPFPDYPSARSRFRLVPEQEVVPELFDHVARHSLKPVEGGWRWKFDNQLVGSSASEMNAAELLQQIQIPVDFAYGADSKVVSAERADRIVELLDQKRPAIQLPNTGHHLMLDQPMATIDLLKSLLT